MERSLWSSGREARYEGDKSSVNLCVSCEAENAARCHHRLSETLSGDLFLFTFAGLEPPPSPYQSTVWSASLHARECTTECTALRPVLLLYLRCGHNFLQGVGHW